MESKHVYGRGLDAAMGKDDCGLLRGAEAGDELDDQVGRGGEV